MEDSMEHGSISCDKRNTNVIEFDIDYHQGDSWPVSR